eukprot:TRINITY_DN11883_c1_g1_i3.p2 TRINITY_DN11883_c1_g1~~TRINITY_DN11883_c1_g1_i3.p2  ORF type:complete len:306 (+),score=42.16 TRINITY_DN11883_c1_g1_i3:1505-2422(+)
MLQLTIRSWLASFSFVILHASMCHTSFDASVLDDLIAASIKNHSFPGCTAIVANESGIVYASAQGHLTYNIPPPCNPDTIPAVTLDTLYDLASLTKVLSTTMATMVLYQRGLIHLDTAIADPSLLGLGFANNGKHGITIRNLLLHNAGYPPDPVPGYWQPASGCPATNQSGVPMVFTCQPQLYTRLLQQTLINPVGEVFVYSDLSMITMMYVLGTVVKANKLVPEASLNADCLAASRGQPSISQCYYEVLCISVASVPVLIAFSHPKLDVCRRPIPFGHLSPSSFIALAALLTALQHRRLSDWMC